MDVSCHELLARTALAGDEYRVDPGLGDLLDLFQQLFDSPRFSDYLLLVEFSANLSQIVHFLSEPPVFYDIADDDLNFLQIEGFGDVIDGSDLHCRDGSLGCLVRGEHDNGRRDLLIRKLFQYVDPAHSGKRDIQQDYIGSG